jgi:hypothetical protein
MTLHLPASCAVVDRNEKSLYPEPKPYSAFSTRDINVAQDVVSY